MVNASVYISCTSVIINLCCRGYESGPACNGLLCWRTHKKMEGQKVRIDASRFRYITGGDMRRRRAGIGGEQEGDSLMHSGEFVGGVHLLVTDPAERGLVGAAQHRRRRPLAHVALYLHPCSSIE
ncbi:hypothetical protein B296_00013329 [Ensete ventricosum]|uniref:Uncharacterized protein n=1 Tax=Ensete ventricosum TaxID=4639 RepID=A0A427ARH2_ENSVE|nr:hypothetical protein B296_00013329 [Ensete ventricosum]